MSFKKILKNKILKPVVYSGLVALSFLSGCERPADEKTKWIEGIVIEENYIPPDTLVKSPEKHIEGLVSQAYSNETIKIGHSKYSFKLKTSKEKVYAINIIDNNDGRKEALDSLISRGSKVKFTKYYNETILSPDLGRSGEFLQTQFDGGVQVGNRVPENIRVLN